MNLLYTARNLIYGGYGRLYNWWASQPQQRSNYGYMYNFYAVSDVRNMAPVGWHIPTRAEYNTLTAYIGTNIDGQYPYTIVEQGSTHWSVANGNATNTTLFTARGSGERFKDGTFDGLGIYSMLWCSTKDGTGKPELIYIDPNYAYTTRMTDIIPQGERYGHAIRYIKDDAILAPAIGNNGNTYNAVTIGTQVWTTQNSLETKYRNGDLIANVTDGVAWAALTTGAYSSYNNTESNAFTTANIAPAGWHVSTVSEWATLTTALGGASLAGGHMKEAGLTHWNTPNTGADNSVLFNARGAGFRQYGAFVSLKEQTWFLASDNYDTTTFLGAGLLSNNSAAITGNGSLYYKSGGYSLRLVKDDSTDPLTLTDIDGNIYPTIKVGTQVWTAMNFKCTRYNDNTPIPYVTGNATWAALTTPAQCVWGNNNLNL